MTLSHDGRNPDMALFITPYGTGGASSRARVYDWLSWTGIDATVASYIGTRNHQPRTLQRNIRKVLAAEVGLHRLKRQHRRHLLLHRQASPFSRGGIEAALLRSAQHSVYDFDDALQWQQNVGAGHWLFSKAATCRAAVATADRVVAGNEVLADWATGYARDVIVIPTCVRPEDYLVKTSYELPDAPRIGWLGSPSTEVYLQFIAAPLLEVNRRTGARLTIISAGTQPLGALDSISDRVEWTPTGFAAALSATDLAVAPLEDVPWARGKCAYKLLQYAATGLPAVASPVGANRQAAERVNASTAESDSDWVEAVVELLDVSAQARAARGTAARQAVATHYSFAAWEATWLAAQGLGQPDEG